MFYYLKFYTKYVFWAFFLLILTVLIYKIFQFNTPVFLEFNNYSVYTNQNIIIFTLLLFSYICLKIFGLIINLNSFFINFKFHFFEKLSTVKSYFGVGYKKEEDILKEIKFFKKKHLYKAGLKLTSQNLSSESIAFYHLFFLLKLGKRREFINTFISRPFGLGIKFFEKFYLKKMFKIRHFFKIRKLYYENPDNQIFTYLFALFLYNSKKYKKSQIILMNFIKNKKILMSDLYCNYLMNLLAIKLEKAIHGETDFILNYKEDIETYHESKRK